jgi:hypothetical protein
VPVRITLGAPGVYQEPATPVHALTGVRMDVAGFAGIAPRGPARVPVVDETHPPGAAMVSADRPRSRSLAVPVQSWEDYRRVFGGFDGPGRLPWAVAAFFAQGGQRAWVVRVVHDYAGAAGERGGVARGWLPGVSAPGVTQIALVARSEGSWGNALRATLSFSTVPLNGTIAAGASELVLSPDGDVTAGALLRLTVAGGHELCWVGSVQTRPHGDARGADRVAILDGAPTAGATAVELVQAQLDLDDGDGRRERFERVGLRAGHPRWLADVLCDASALAWPDPAWTASELLPDPKLGPAIAATPWVCGEDRYRQIVPEDMLDGDWVPGEEPDTRTAGGIHALLEAEEVALLCVPDLYEPEAFALPQPFVATVPPAGPAFERCLQRDDAAVAPAVVAALDGLTLDPRTPGDLETIVGLQARVIGLAEYAGWSALIDVPPGLTRRAILRWRARHDSAFAACYHPWLRVHGLGPASLRPVRVPPSAVAAGIVAACERQYGIPHGPAGVVAQRVVAAEQPLTSAEHDELHRAGVNAFLLERDGVRLSAARTLSGDPQWRQLSVRRIVTMTERALRAQMAWTVFEPADGALRGRLRHMLSAFLRTLHGRGALAGALPEEGYFVRCDDTNNPPASVDAGRLVVDVGIAPVEPLEYIVVRLERGDDGAISLGGSGG